MMAAEVHLARLIIVYKERNSTQANLLQAGFISVYNALIFAIYQMIFKFTHFCEQFRQETL